VKTLVAEMQSADSEDVPAKVEELREAVLHDATEEEREQDGPCPSATIRRAVCRRRSP
jgi:hypothetical protein